MPGHVTLQNFLITQSARNPKLIRIMTKFPNAPNKDVGEGLNTAFEAMKKLRLKTPELEETENSVVVYLDHAPLGSPEDAVMVYLKTNEEITNRAGPGDHRHSVGKHDEGSFLSARKARSD